MTFNAPGTLGPRFTGTITSAALAATPINSNLGGVDDGDLVTFAISVVNSGSSPKGAFDVVIEDSIPTGFVAPGIGDLGINLRVTDGAGRLLPYRITGGSMLGGSGGIELIDPAPDRGAIGPAATDGSDVVVVTYDLRLANNTVLDTLTNVGEVTSYAGSEGGPDFTGSDSLTDPAVVVIGDNSLLDKQLLGTEIVNATNSLTDAVIGEFVTYRVTITVPEATMPGAILTDTLDEELAFVALDSAVLSSGVSITVITTPVVLNNGRDLLFKLGDITNSNTDNAVTETITLTYRAIVVNTAASQANDQANNSARFTFTGLASPITAAATNVRIIEPQVQIAKSVSVDGAGNTGDAGDSFVYTIVLSNPPGASQFTADAFDLTFSDLLQAGLPTSPLNLTGFTVTDTLGQVTAANFELVTDPGTGQLVLRTTAAGAFDMLVNATRTITIQVSGSLAQTLVPGQVIPNSAEVQLDQPRRRPRPAVHVFPQLDGTHRRGRSGRRERLSRQRRSGHQHSQSRTEQVGGDHLGERDRRSHGRGRRGNRSLPRPGRRPGFRHADEFPVHRPAPYRDGLRCRKRPDRPRDRRRGQPRLLDLDRSRPEPARPLPDRE